MEHEKQEARHVFDVAALEIQKSRLFILDEIKDLYSKYSHYSMFTDPKLNFIVKLLRDGVFYQISTDKGISTEFDYYDELEEQHLKAILNRMRAIAKEINRIMI